MVRLQQSKRQFFLTIPKELVESKGWKKGQVLIIGFNQDGDLIIKEGKKI